MLKTADKSPDRPGQSPGSKITNATVPFKIEVEMITPEIARAYLERNTHNRRLAHKQVDLLARDMKSGAWRLTGDMIRFDRNNNLIDGQHRLEACVKADVPFQSLVGYGFDPKDQDVIDSGRVRSAADMLTLNNIQASAHVAAVCRLILAAKQGVALNTIKSSNAEILRIAKERPEIVRTIGLCWRCPPGIRRVPLAYVHYSACRAGKQELADAFVTVFTTGVQAYEGDPAHALRERMIRVQNGGSQYRINPNDTIRALTHCFNLFAARERIQRFQMPHRGEVPLVGLDSDKL